MESSSLRVTQRWAQPKSPNSRADTLHPSDSITFSSLPYGVPSWRGEEPPPDPVCAALPGAAAEGWMRFWGQRGCPCHRASPALEMQPHGNIITAKRQKCPVKGCAPRLCYAPARSGLFSRWVLALHGYLSNCWQQAVNIARYSSSRQLLPETRTHGAT